MIRRTPYLSALFVPALLWACPALAQTAAPPPAIASAAPRAAVLSDQDAALIQQIQTYLDQIRTLKARFLQIAPDGQTTTGTAWLQRPGRMRFAYDKPSPLLLVAGHGLVVFHDSALDQTTNIPIGQTPLGLLLSDKLTLSGDVTASALERSANQVQLTLYRTRSPGDGSLTLIFANPPLALRGWSVIDAQGRETRITLDNVVLGGSFDQSLFTFIDPNFFNQNGASGGN